MNISKSLKLQNISITSRTSDGYINATQLCKAGNKMFGTYYRRKRTKDFLKKLVNDVQNDISLLIKYKTGYGSNQITWVHPQVAINIAQWISPEFDLKVSKWVYELMLFGNVDINKERTYKELEEKLHNKNIMIENLTKQLDMISCKYKQLNKAHRGILKHKSVHYFKKGKCFYVISNMKENKTENRIKVGISFNINKRLTTLRTGIPHLRLHYLVFLNEYDLLEKIIKEHYKYQLNPNNHEFISGVEIHTVHENL